MKEFDKKKAILKIINANLKGVSFEEIIDYLDFINKVRYEDKEIKEILDSLILKNKIVLIINIYKKA